MGWRDYNQGNLYAFEGDLGPVEVRKYEKEKVKARQKGSTKLEQYLWARAQKDH